MSDIRLDHVVIAVTDWERANAFYRDVCGAELVRMDDGPSTYWRYRFGEQQLNVHGPGVEPAPVARRDDGAGQRRPVPALAGADRGGGRAPARPRRGGRAGAGAARGRAWDGHERLLPRSGRLAARVHLLRLRLAVEPQALVVVRGVYSITEGREALRCARPGRSVALS